MNELAWTLALDRSPAGSPDAWPGPNRDRHATHCVPSGQEPSLGLGMRIARELGASSLMVEVHPTLVPERLEQRAQALAKIVRDVLG